LKNALVAGMGKTGTTIVASVIQSSLPGAELYMELKRIGPFEKYVKNGVPVVVKIIYEHWMKRPFLLKGIICGETGLNPDRIVAIVRDPRDGLISVLLYGAYHCVLDGASREQVEAWVDVIQDKEANPQKHSVIGLIEHMNKIFGLRLSPNDYFDTFVNYSAWIGENRARLHVLSYEDFVAGNTGELAAYLGIKLKRSREVIPSLQRVSRSRGSGDWRRLMLPEDVTFWKERYGPALERHGYKDWEVHPQRLDPALGSSYIRRITEEAFESRGAKSAHPGGAASLTPRGGEHSGNVPHQQQRAF
jgi:hypothetical protein